MSTILHLPVSLGEAIDKLTILDIKQEKIIDNRKNDVKTEFDLLNNSLKEFIINYESLYKTMKKVNLLIWDMMESLRDGDLNEEMYLKICKECIDYNDIRFRVKNKINFFSGSILKEQKSYKINRLVIKVEKNIIDFFLQDIIKYYSFIYDEIIIESYHELSYLRDYFYYDISILFKTVNDMDYKTKILIEKKDYCKDELLKIFGIWETEIYKII